MSQVNSSSDLPVANSVPTFVDRRNGDNAKKIGVERRQFGNTYQQFSPDARELAEAIDSYKVEHHRRYVTYEEMLQVIRELGYHK